ncbi:hypothetical protein BDQ17DRAFT_1332481 [Cyathus striatus]|nr:hypothetical protein BDQ17DRAFT_1332481 [Cyathus striatus]
MQIFALATRQLKKQSSNWHSTLADQETLNLDRQREKLSRATIGSAYPQPSGSVSRSESESNPKFAQGSKGPIECVFYTLALTANSKTTQSRNPQASIRALLDSAIQVVKKAYGNSMGDAMLCSDQLDSEAPEDNSPPRLCLRLLADKHSSLHLRRVHPSSLLEMYRALVFQYVALVRSCSPAMATGRLAILLPIKEGNDISGGLDENLHVEIPDNLNPFPKTINFALVKTFLYQDMSLDPVLKEKLMPKILPELLTSGAIQPNRVRLLNQGSFKDRVGLGLEVLRNSKTNGEKIVVKLETCHDPMAYSSF